MRSSDLQGKPVRAEGGERLGRVNEIHTAGGEVRAITCGRGGFLQRFVASRRGRRVKWSDVVRLTDAQIVVRRG